MTKNSSSVTPSCGKKMRKSHDTICERGFENLGKAIVKRPWTSLILTFFIGLAFAGGFAILKSENRPEKLWVPSTAAALKQKDYVDKVWPSTTRIELFMARCKQEGCNILDAKYLQRLDDIHRKIVSFGFSDEEARLSDSDYVNIPDEKWEVFKGNWSYDGTNGTSKKCVTFGPECGVNSILSIFDFEEFIIDNLNEEQVSMALNTYPNLKAVCPLTLTREDSPCVNASVYGTNTTKHDDCQIYSTTQQRNNCREAMKGYCNKVCPYRGPCEDPGCQGIAWLLRRNINAPRIAANPTPLKKWVSGGSKHPSGPLVKGDASPTYDGKYLFGFYALEQSPILSNGAEIDPIATYWEKQAMCLLGVSSETPNTCPQDDLLEFSVQFTSSLGSEFGGTISGDIKFLGIGIGLVIVYLVIMLSRRDTVHSMMGVSIVAILIVGLSYLGCMGAGGYFGIYNNNLNNNIPFLLLGLGVDDAFVLTSEYFRSKKRNPAESDEYHVINACKYGGVSILITSTTDALAFLVGSTTVLPALSWFCLFSGVGIVLCFLFQIFIFLPALLINARRASANRYDLLCCFKSTNPCCCLRKSSQPNEETYKEKGGATGEPSKSQASKVGDADATSVVVEVEKDDASETTSQKGENEKSAKVASKEKNKSSNTEKHNGREIIQHDFNKPRGCCCCIGLNNKLNCRADSLSHLMEGFATKLITVPGKVITLLLFAGLLAAGGLGCSRMYRDFKLEWFIPDGSYLKTFEQWNTAYFAVGTPITVYVKDIDYFAKQKNMSALYKYLNTSSYIDQTETLNSWYRNFQVRLLDNQKAPEWFDDVSDTVSAAMTNETIFYQELWRWYKTGQGAWNGDASDIIWTDPDCNNNTLTTCNYSRGIYASKLSATIGLEYTSTGQIRYDTMTKLREDIDEILPSSFPFSFQFLYWEEVGIIDVEFMQNVLICGAVILVIVFILTPPVVAIWVMVSIISSLVAIVGCLYWWGVTISGVSTIFILISVGLTVDYSAHIAHMFASSEGTKNERAIKSLKRIGPSVFHAVLSTLLAVVVIGASESYVFRIFFKVLLVTVLIGGAHGLLLLPVILSLAGGRGAGKKPDKKNAKIGSLDVEASGQKEIEMKEVENEKTTA